MKYPPRKIFDAVAVSSTTTYKSLVVRAAEHDVFLSGSSTSTATAVISVEFNDMDERDYRLSTGAAADAEPTAAQEASNTTGWKVLPVFYYDTGTSAMSTTGTIAQAATGTFSVKVKKGKMRLRLSWANATGSGAVTAMSKAND